MNRWTLVLEPDAETDDATLAELMEFCVAANARWAQKNPDAPCCAACGGVEYVPPVWGRERQAIYHAPALLERGHGSCADLACYDAGIARSKGKRAHVQLEPVAPGDWHAVAIVDGVRIDSAEKAEGKE